MAALLLPLVFSCGPLFLAASPDSPLAGEAETTLATEVLGLVMAASASGAGSAGASTDAPSGGGDSGATGGGVSGSSSGTQQLGVATATTNGEAIATDASGNVYMVGFTNGDLDGVTRTGLTDFYLTKYDPAGDKRFTRMLGVTARATYGYGVAADSAGNVYVAGYTLGNLDGQLKIGTWDLFLTKYDSAGNKQFTRLMGAIGKTTTAKAIVIDAADNIYLAGHTRGAIGGQTPSGNQDMLLMKFDAAGNMIYTRLLGTFGGFVWGEDVAVDTSGNVFVTGYTSRGLNGNTQTGILDVFVAKYAANGTLQWARQLGGPGSSTRGQGLATDASGNVFATGYTNGGIDGNTLIGLNDTFLIQYDVAGTKAYTTTLGIAGANIQALAAVTDGTGAVYLSGYADAGMDGNALTGTADLFLSKYDTGGTRLFTRQLGTAGQTTTTRALAMNPGEIIFTGGNTTGGLDGNVLMGAQDFFFAQYDTSGVKQ